MDQISDQGAIEGYSQEPEAGLLSETPTETPATYVTPEQLEQRFGDLEDRIVTRLSSALQSRKDKAIDNLSKQLADLEQRITQAKASGIPIPDDIAAQARSRIYQQHLTDDQDSDGAEAEAGPPMPPPEIPRKVLEARAKAAALAAQYGFDVYPSDPEYRMVNMKEPDPDRWYQSVEIAMRRKAQRTGAAQIAASPTPAGVAPSGRQAAAPTINDITAELNRLSAVRNPNKAQLDRMNEIEQAIMAQVPKKLR